MGVAGIVERGARILGIELPPGASSVFEAYYAMLESRGKHVNLTAITGEEDVARLHFLDSLAMMKYAHFAGARVIDIGSGAGFPGLPLIIADKSIVLTLLDATAKRVAFVSDLCMELGIEAECIHARAEEAARVETPARVCESAQREVSADTIASAHAPQMREMFDIALSRAVARLNVLCELCLPFVTVGGVFLAMKGTDSAEELDEAHGAIQKLGAAFEGTEDYTIPEMDIQRRVVIIRKTSATPQEYPRRFAKIQKSPLGGCAPEPLDHQ